MNGKQDAFENARSTNETDAPARLRSRDLFRSSNRVEIEHRGETYRLQITRQGKLILTK